MASKTRLAAALALAVAGLVAPAAHAEPQIIWQRCGVTTSTDAFGSSNAYSGEVHAGPIVVTDGTRPGDPVTLVCSIQAYSATYGEGVRLATAYSSPGVGTAILPPTAFNFIAVNVNEFFLCSGFWTKLPDGTWVHSVDDVDVDKIGIQCAAIDVILGD